VLAVLPTGVPQTSDRMRSLSPVLNKKFSHQQEECPLSNDRIKGVIKKDFDYSGTANLLAPFIDVQDLDASLSD
jgi:hypothetical protein